MIPPSISQGQQADVRAEDALADARRYGQVSGGAARPAFMAMANAYTAQITATTQMKADAPSDGPTTYCIDGEGYAKPTGGSISVSRVHGMGNLDHYYYLSIMGDVGHQVGVTPPPHSPSLTHSLYHTRALSHSFSLSLTLAHALSHPHSLTLLLFPTLSHHPALSPTNTLSPHRVR